MEDRRTLLRWLRTYYDAGPRFKSPAGRHGAWRSRIGHLLFQQEATKVNILGFDASSMAEPFASCSIAATSYLEKIFKKNRKMHLFCTRVQTDLHALADLIRFPPPRDHEGAARGMAQSGSASALGAEGRGFESLCPDQLR